MAVMFWVMVRVVAASYLTAWDVALRSSKIQRILRLVRPTSSTSPTTSYMLDRFIHRKVRQEYESVAFSSHLPEGEGPELAVDGVDGKYCVFCGHRNADARARVAGRHEGFEELDLKEAESCAPDAFVWVLLSS